MSRLSDRISTMIQAKFDELGLTDLNHEVTLDIIPGPQGPQPVMLVAMTMPSTVLGEWVTGVSVLPNLMPTEEQVEGAVLQMLQSLRAQRDQTNQQVMASAASSNGHKETAPGDGPRLILPGT